MDRHKGSTQLERLEVVETGRRRRPIGAQSEQSGFARVVLAAEVEPAVAATPASGQMVIIAGRDRRVIVDVTSSAGAGQPGHSPCARRSVQPEDRDRGPGTGDYIAERDYRSMKKGGRTPIVPDAKGNNTVLVDTWAHANPIADRIRRQVTEGSVIQATGRGRLGQRSEINPLDIHLWNDGPLPELGPVEPVLWDEIAVGLDELMLATGGVWLENVTHAAKAYRGLLSAKSLQQAR
jgi:hypothetical protein